MDLTKIFKKFVEDDMKKVDEIIKYYCIYPFNIGGVYFEVNDTHYTIIDWHEYSVKILYHDGFEFAFWVDKSQFEASFATELKAKLVNLTNNVI